MRDFFETVRFQMCQSDESHSATIIKAIYQWDSEYMEWKWLL